MNLENLPIVKVEWLDAMSDDNTWQKIEDLERQTLRIVYSVGWLLKDNPKTIILISSFDSESQCGGGGTTIPKNCVTNITYLQKPKRLKDRI